MANGRPEATANIALLIDADNASPSRLDAVLTVLAELGTVNVRRVYGNWSKPGLRGWSELSHRYALDPHQQFDVTKGKNATDMRMVIDAMDLLYSGRVHGFGIMSSDSDFAPLVMRLRNDGLPVYGFGSTKTPVSFRQACTRFIDIDVLVAATATATAEAGPAAPAPAAAKPIDAEVVDLLVQALASSKRDEQGFASLSEVGQRAGNRSSFDARNYGFARLVDLVEAIPSLKVERREDGRVFIKRLR